MGTRSLTVIVDEEGKEVVVLYRQYDGHPASHGLQLSNFLKPLTLMNGTGPVDTANGMNCLAAQIIAHFKVGSGNFYLYAAGTRDMGEEFIYTVYPKQSNIFLKVMDAYHPNTPLFDGMARKFGEIPKKLKI